MLTTSTGTKLKYRSITYAQGKDPSTLPIVLLFGGFDTAAKAIELFKPTIPMTLASFDYPYEKKHKYNHNPLAQDYNTLHYFGLNADLPLFQKL